MRRPVEVTRWVASFRRGCRTGGGETILHHLVQMGLFDPGIWADEKEDAISKWLMNNSTTYGRTLLNTMNKYGKVGDVRRALRKELVGPDHSVHGPEWGQITTRRYAEQLLMWLDVAVSGGAL